MADREGEKAVEISIILINDLSLTARQPEIPVLAS
jgi:hypothetical protein